MNRMSKREKVLVYIMVLVLVLVGGVVLAIQPEMGRLESDRAALEEVYLRQIDIQGTLLGEEAARERSGEIARSIDRSTAQFYPYLTNDLLDTRITGIIKNCGLAAESLQITAGERPDYLAGDADATRDDFIVIRQVSINARGTLQGVVNLADQLSAINGAQIDNMAFTRVTSGTLGAQDEPGDDYQLSVTVLIFMVDTDSLAAEREAIERLAEPDDALPGENP